MAGLEACPAFQLLELLVQVHRSSLYAIRKSIYHLIPEIIQVELLILFCGDRYIMQVDSKGSSSNQKVSVGLRWLLLLSYKIVSPDFNSCKHNQY